MTNKIYKLSFSPKSGFLTDFYSDTIFGHFVWELSRNLSEKDLEGFLQDFEKKPIFTISNGFYENENDIFLPKPMIHIPFEKNEEKLERIKNKLNGKELKKKKFVNLEIFKYLVSKKLEEAKECFEKLEIPNFFEEDLKTQVEISRESGIAVEGKKLFSTTPRYFVKNMRIVFFIKILDQENFELYEVEENLKKSFESGFGKKKSVGMGVLEDPKFEEFSGFNDLENLQDYNSVVSLSNFVPDKSDPTGENSKWETFVKYGKLGEEFSNSQNPFKKPILFFSAGSVLDFKNDKERENYENKNYLGKILKNISVNEKVIQNATAFTLKAKIS